MGGWVQDGAGSLHHDGNTDIWGGGEVPVAPQRVKNIPRMKVTDVKQETRCSLIYF